MKKVSAVIAASAAVLLTAGFGAYYAYASPTVTVHPLPALTDQASPDDATADQPDQNDGFVPDDQAGQADAIHDDCVTVHVTTAANDPQLSDLMSENELTNNVHTVFIRGVRPKAIDDCNTGKNRSARGVHAIHGSRDVALQVTVGENGTSRVRLPRGDRKVLLYVSTCFSPEQLGRFVGTVTPDSDKDVTLPQQFFGQPPAGQCLRQP